MANWNQKTANYIKGQINDWTEEFLVSSYATGLKRDKALEILPSFADYMYETHVRTPKTWMGYGVKEVVEKEFKHDLKSAITYLTSFLSFLDDKSYIKNAKTLIHALEEINVSDSLHTSTSSNQKTEVVKKTTTSSTKGKNPYNHMVQQKQHYNKLIGKKKKRKKHSR